MRSCRFGFQCSSPAMSRPALSCGSRRRTRPSASFARRSCVWGVVLSPCTSDRSLRSSRRSRWSRAGAGQSFTGSWQTPPDGSSESRCSTRRSGTGARCRMPCSRTSFLTSRSATSRSISLTRGTTSETAFRQHARYFTLQLADSYFTPPLFRQIVARIEQLTWNPTSSIGRPLSEARLTRAGAPSRRAGGGGTPADLRDQRRWLARTVPVTDSDWPDWVREASRGSASSRRGKRTSSISDILAQRGFDDEVMR